MVSRITAKASKAELAVGHEVRVGRDQMRGLSMPVLARYSSISMVRRFDSSAISSSSPFRHLDVVTVSTCSLHDIFGGDFLAGVGVDLGIFDAMPVLRVDLVELTFSVSDVAG